MASKNYLVTAGAFGILGTGDYSTGLKEDKLEATPNVQLQTSHYSIHLQLGIYQKIVAISSILRRLLGTMGLRSELPTYTGTFYEADSSSLMA